KLFLQSSIDKELLRKRVLEILKVKNQTTIQEVIDSSGGIEKGLPELFGYISIAKEFKYTINSNRVHSVNFNSELNKSIQIPEIIITK
ncbi:MAG: DUF3375 family protein, partial [Cyclobacteriaceae bacterium]